MPSAEAEASLVPACRDDRALLRPRSRLGMHFNGCPLWFQGGDEGTQALDKKEQGPALRASWGAEPKSGA